MTILFVFLHYTKPIGSNKVMFVDNSPHLLSQTNPTKHTKVEFVFILFSNNNNHTNKKCIFTVSLRFVRKMAIIWGKGNVYKAWLQQNKPSLIRHRQRNGTAAAQHMVIKCKEKNRKNNIYIAIRSVQECSCFENVWNQTPHAFIVRVKFSRRWTVCQIFGVADFYFMLYRASHKQFTINNDNQKRRYLGHFCMCNKEKSETLVF